ncbi:MAG: hypothetical protein AAFO94_16285 [Bacteroidota bacterium]
MKNTLAILVFTLLALNSNALFAQTANNVDDAKSYGTELTEATTDNWTFYADEDNRLYYVDFENIKFNLSDVVVKNADGEVLMRDDVLDLPVNTIYEIDLNNYDSGKYSIELRSFTSVIRKEVDLR